MFFASLGGELQTAIQPSESPETRMMEEVQGMCGREECRLARQENVCLCDGGSVMSRPRNFSIYRSYCIAVFVMASIL